MSQTIDSIMEFIEENDVKFIKLQFCDIFGDLRNISITASQLERAFVDGISFDASAVKGFLNVEDSDLFLFPDINTLSILPWRPREGRVIRFFCNIRKHDGTAFAGDSRVFLQKAIEDLKGLGYSCNIGPECEFYLFKTDEEGEPILVPHDRAGYAAIPPKDKGENVRREICLTLEEMGIVPESSHHESGPGQNEVDFLYDSPLNAADNLITFKSVVKTVAARNGLYASFMPKPFAEESGSGMHINLSLVKEGKNLFQATDQHNIPEVEYFIAGVLKHIKEITAILNPTVNSYKRFGAHEAPKYITWSHNNRSQLIRIPAATGKYRRMELRSADPSCNPYLAFALLIYAGIDGIKNRLPLVESVDLNLYKVLANQVEGFDRLPANLREAVDQFRNSDFVRQLLPEEFLDKYLMYKDEEWKLYSNNAHANALQITQWEIEQYFAAL